MEVARALDIVLVLLEVSEALSVRRLGAFAARSSGVSVSEPGNSEREELREKQIGRRATHRCCRFCSFSLSFEGMATRAVSAHARAVCVEP